MKIQTSKLRQLTIGVQLLAGVVLLIADLLTSVQDGPGEHVNVTTFSVQPDTSANGQDNGKNPDTIKPLPNNELLLPNQILNKNT